MQWRQEGEALQQQQGGGRAEQPSGQALRMLAAYLDASAHIELQGEQREVKAQLRGLRLDTQVDLGGQGGEVRGRVCTRHQSSFMLGCVINPVMLFPDRGCNGQPCQLIALVQAGSCSGSYPGADADPFI